MRQMHSGVSKSDPRVGSRQQHVGAGFLVGWIVDGANDILRHHSQSLQRPHVADRIRALIGRANRGPIGYGLPVYGIAVYDSIA